MQDNIEIRLAREHDAAALSDLAQRTFRKTFSKDNTASDIEMHIKQTCSPEIQLSEILDPKRLIFMAWRGDKAIGYIHIHQSSPDPSVKGAKPIEILRLYVDLEWHGKGVASQLMKSGITLCKLLGHETVWLGVWEKNIRAQTFYKKWAFAEVGSHPFKLGLDLQRDLVMERQI